MKEEVVFIISSLGLSTEQWTAECVLQSVQELQPAPGCAMGDSFPDRAETLARWEANYANDRLDYFQLQIHCKTFNTEF